jgi:signal transduction histidine kinase
MGVEGVGLGLAVAQRIAVALHGRIVVSSAGPGRGSRLILRLPQGSTTVLSQHPAELLPAGRTD